ncbi:hypothetical protein KJ966_28690, partial [bacterium]|nr:hypothetical protein [bacterium]
RNGFQNNGMYKDAITLTLAISCLEKVGWATCCPSIESNVGQQVAQPMSRCNFLTGQCCKIQYFCTRILFGDNPVIRKIIFFNLHGGLYGM